ncbi:transmembrane protein 252 [Sceloporus undulatus]|uniref:transmembrane protein 252 n=1 Tax=Sceloporus undulatus TaxID=8520 RepID=UPI001C4A89D9|nr:transmembrane protein 252 [Sceloporus undulatus]
MSKNLLTFLRFFVLLLGFSIICLGAFCISTGAPGCKCNSLPIAYFLLPLGFFLLITGIFWSTYHEASKHKSLFHSILSGNRRIRESHVNTIDRPDFYPPSYEDSTDPEKQTFPLPVSPLEREKETYNIPPPLYTESSFEFIDEASTQEEQPPSYEASLKQGTTEHDSTPIETSSPPVPETSC